MYYAVGVGSNLAGRGGDLVIIDDPHSEQTAMSSSGLMMLGIGILGPPTTSPAGGSIVLVQTGGREGYDGATLRAMAKDELADQWKLWSYRQYLKMGLRVGLSFGVLMI